jgi:hypothetical protein
MSKIKIAVALIAIAALALVVVGLVSAQIAPAPTSQSANPNTAATNGGFFGWIGRCFGYGTNQPYYGSNPYQAPQTPTNPSVPAPNQGNYGYGYGYGPCWAR